MRLIVDELQFPGGFGKTDDHEIFCRSWIEHLIEAHPHLGRRPY